MSCTAEQGSPEPKAGLFQALSQKAAFPTPGCACEETSFCKGRILRVTALDSMTSFRLLAESTLSAESAFAKSERSYFGEMFTFGSSLLFARAGFLTTQR
jgi:hypothetical protein